MKYIKYIKYFLLIILSFLIFKTTIKAEELTKEQKAIAETAYAYKRMSYGALSSTKNITMNGDIKLYAIWKKEINEDTLIDITNNKEIEVVYGKELNNIKEENIVKNKNYKIYIYSFISYL